MFFLVFYRSMIDLQVLFYLVLWSVYQFRKDQLLNKKCACNFSWETSPSALALYFLQES